MENNIYNDAIRWQIHDFQFDSNSDVRPVKIYESKYVSKVRPVKMYEIFANQIKC